ncbi:MAG: NAD(P)/FAD-dependent oxidoreductase [Thermoanaerobaculia bacterium]
MTYDFAIVGSGFASSLLARILAGAGARVILLEKDRHPRFALGESSTPLGNLCLERLARRWDLPDLYDLATHGRWLDRRPDLERGLKRGFTFWFHDPEREFEPGTRNRNRLMVAASPEDRLADTHWLRRDVDAYFVSRAIEAGAELREGTEVVAARRDRDRVVLDARSAGELRTIVADLVIDGSGRAGVVAEHLGVGLIQEPARFSSSLVYSHFEEVPELAAVAPDLPRGPYPEEWAAVHHLVDEGWLYSLRFDCGRVSAGLVWIEEPAGCGPAWAGTAPEEQWRHVLARYPTLHRQFGAARAARPIERIHRLQYRRHRASGAGWLALPHAFAFFEPMFSTGIAWSLRSVELLAEALVEGSQVDRPAVIAAYARRLESEADQIERLIYAAYLARRDAESFAALSFLYFAAVSHAEASERLLGTGSVDGFLGAGSSEWEAVYEEAVERLLGRRDGDFVGWVERRIRPWNLAGLADPARHNLYPVDLDLLVERAGLLGLSREEAVRRLPLFRGDPVEI